MSLIAEPDLLDRLPEWARIAQDAVITDEVQSMIKRLGELNLAVCMPHAHAVDENGSDARSMTPLPAGIVQIERDLVNTFVPASEAHEDDLLPVAWRWENGVVVCASTCPHE